MCSTVDQPREVERNGVSKNGTRVEGYPGVFVPVVPWDDRRYHEREYGHHRDIDTENRETIKLIANNTVITKSRL